jgi:hypothetical protein
MLRGWLMEKLAVFTLGDNFHCVILGYRPVESVLKCFFDDRSP